MKIQHDPRQFRTWDYQILEWYQFKIEQMLFNTFLIPIHLISNTSDL